jgi:hypothetical protein
VRVNQRKVERLESLLLGIVEQIEAMPDLFVLVNIRNRIIEEPNLRAAILKMRKERRKRT